ncbi:MAG: response regulator transcription factor [Planctomycetaceae bacterium]
MSGSESTETHILVVEDEPALRDGLRFNFEQEGYAVDVAGDGLTAIARFEEAGESLDLVILDLMLPGMSGYEVCRKMREQNKTIPILVLSARTLSEDKAQAFDCGSDQYVTKPFELPELLSRVRNLLDRHSRPGMPVESSEPESEPVQVGEVMVDLRRFEIHRDGETQTLTTMEQQLLKYFLQNEGVVLSRSDIMENVWGETADITTRSIDNFVLRLRRLIEKDSGSPEHILSVRGTGYRFLQTPPA